MMYKLKQLIIQWLGGVSRHEHHYICDKLKNAEAERDVYKEVSDTVFIYIGSYPVWKAQQEFREMLHGMGQPLTPLEPEKMAVEPYSKAQAVDYYLGKLVDTFFVLKSKLPYPHGVTRCHFFETREALEHARGAGYLAGNTLAE